jgi:hypothetical protein
MRRRTRLFVLVGLLLALASPFWFPRIIASCRFAFRLHRPQAQSKGPGYPRLSGLNLANVTFHRGLSSGHLRPHDFLRELWLAETCSSSGYYFFAGEFPLSEAAKKKAITLLSEPTNFRPYRVGKACGGFHADFLLRSHREPHADCLVCLGCGEVICIIEGEKTLYDLENAAWKELIRVFKAPPAD